MTNNIPQDEDIKENVNDLKKFLNTMSSGRNIREEIFNMHENYPIIITEVSMSSNDEDDKNFLKGEDYLIEDDE